MLVQQQVHVVALATPLKIVIITMTVYHRGLSQEEATH